MVDKNKVWENYFGNNQSGIDFTGREIKKGSYNQPNSKYGWDIDHIYPKSKGGTDKLENLIPVHNLTNDEKGDKFPVFTANSTSYTIHNQEGMWKIKRTHLDFYDYKSVFKYIDENNKIESFYNDSINIYIEKVKKTKINGIINLINEIFKLYKNNLNNHYKISIKNSSYGYSNEYNDLNIEIGVKNIKNTENHITKELLSNLVLINTYLSYFCQSNNKFIEKYNIVIIEEFIGNNKIKEFYFPIETFKINWYENTIIVNSLIYDNVLKNDMTEEQLSKLNKFSLYRKNSFDNYENNQDTYYRYNYIKTNLHNSLNKSLEQEKK
ncbi:HNH endonuclease [Mycoplasma sp. CSL10166]|uniref:HNH endonuclease n=1 Tax=Mycoplasma sp. CSL10166 TaxID=2813825 RepID=UPI00197B8AEC|nr:HNH endonuclease signature motif containing protein [Mycoplasma sp. CSL10166]MBN4084419.1 HNH endonuclease [Mycoplasma sp. CSL10166]